MLVRCAEGAAAMPFSLRNSALGGLTDAHTGLTELLCPCFPRGCLNSYIQMDNGSSRRQLLCPSRRYQKLVRAARVPSPSSPVAAFNVRRVDFGNQSRATQAIMTRVIHHNLVLPDEQEKPLLG